MIDTARGRLPVGTIDVGTIFKPSGRFAPLIVEGWLSRDYAKYDGAARTMRTVRISGGHIAVVRCLASGKRMHVADCRIRQAEDTFR